MNEEKVTILVGENNFENIYMNVFGKPTKEILYFPKDLDPLSEKERILISSENGLSIFKTKVTIKEWLTAESCYPIHEGSDYASMADINPSVSLSKVKSNNEFNINSFSFYYLFLLVFLDIIIILLILS